MTETVLNIVQEVLNLLAEKKYDNIAVLTKGIRLSSDDIFSAISEYGKEIVSPPLNFVDFLDVVKVQDEGTYSVWTPLWTREEGRSDLTLRLKIIFRGKDAIVELDDILVS